MARGTEIEQFCLRLELAWKRQPHRRLGEILTASQALTLAPQARIDDARLIEAVELHTEASE